MVDWYQNRSLILMILFVAVIIPFIQKIKFKTMFDITNIDSELPSIGSVLLLIAHPDDEIMFWTPTIKYFLSQKIELKILCLSNGNYNGLGDLREIEFDNVSRELNLSHNVILNDPELQDDINKKWDPNKVSEMIDDFLNKNNDIKTIITFDNNGVTKHPNHISCFEGLMFYLNKYKEECSNKNIKVFTLKSFNFVLQYTWIIPMLNCFINKYGFMTNTFFTSFRLMSFYETQFNLLRKAHIILSSYSYFNSYNKIIY